MSDIQVTVFCDMTQCRLLDTCEMFGEYATPVLKIDETSMLINIYMFQLHVNFRLHCQDVEK